MGGGAARGERRRKGSERVAVSSQIWLGDWVWCLTFLCERQKRIKVSKAEARADDALERYKKRVMK